VIRASRLTLSLFGLLALAPAGAAEAQSLSFGLMAGGSLSTFTGDISSDAKHYAGYIVGGFLHLEAAGFAIQPGLFYSVKGVKSSDFSGRSDGKTTLDYIQIPLMLRIGMGSSKARLYVAAGPAIGLKIGCSVSAAASGYGSGGTDCKDAVLLPSAKSSEISGIVEAGLEFGKFSVGARGDLGLSNAFEAIQSGSSANVNVKTRTVSLVAAIRL
jgi:hypothetical protein